MSDQGTRMGYFPYDWDPVERRTGAAAGVAAKVPKVAWLATVFPMSTNMFTPRPSSISFNGKPTGEVASFRVEGGELRPLSAGRTRPKVGTCHVAVDHTGQHAHRGRLRRAEARPALPSPTGNSASKAVWTERYTFHRGPTRTGRQLCTSLHFVSFSPDSPLCRRKINDLGGDCIHIYKPDTATAAMTLPAGKLSGLRRAPVRGRCTFIPTATRPIA